MSFLENYKERRHFIALTRSKPDKVDETYQGIWGSEKSKQATRLRFEWICSKTTGSLVLDIGCSQGTLGFLLSDREIRYVGLDLIPEPLAYAQEKKRRELGKDSRNRIQFLRSWSEETPFRDGVFDTIVLGEMLEHVREPQCIIHEVRRLLRANGRIVVTVPYGFSPSALHINSFFFGSLLALLQGCFVCREISTMGDFLLYVGTKKEKITDAALSDFSNRVLGIAESKLEELQLSHYSLRNIEHRMHLMRRRYKKLKRILGIPLFLCRTVFRIRSLIEFEELVTAKGVIIVENLQDDQAAANRITHELETMGVRPIVISLRGQERTESETQSLKFHTMRVLKGKYLRSFRNFYYLYRTGVAIYIVITPLALRSAYWVSRLHGCRVVFANLSGAKKVHERDCRVSIKYMRKVDKVLLLGPAEREIAEFLSLEKDRLISQIHELYS